MTDKKLKELLENPSRKIDKAELIDILCNMRDDIKAELERETYIEPMRYYAGELCIIELAIELAYKLEI